MSLVSRKALSQFWRCILYICQISNRYCGGNASELRTQRTSEEDAPHWSRLGSSWTWSEPCVRRITIETVYQSGGRRFAAMASNKLSCVPVWSCTISDLLALWVCSITEGSSKGYLSTLLDLVSYYAASHPIFRCQVSRPVLALGGNCPALNETPHYAYLKVTSSLSLFPHYFFRSSSGVNADPGFNVSWKQSEC